MHRLFKPCIDPTGIAGGLIDQGPHRCLFGVKAHGLDHVRVLSSHTRQGHAGLAFSLFNKGALFWIRFCHGRMSTRSTSFLGGFVTPLQPASGGPLCFGWTGQPFPPIRFFSRCLFLSHHHWESNCRTCWATPSNEPTLDLAYVSVPFPPETSCRP